MKSFARAGQDMFLLELFFRGQRNGVFVDIGARDGETASNSLLFERFMGWRGLCTESNPAQYAQLVTRRKCACESAPVQNLSALFGKHALTTIDCCSINLPGQELDLIAGLDTEQFRVSVFVIESTSPEPLVELMGSRGYVPVTRMEQSLIFRRRDHKPLARTSVICAVWHGDPDRERLLEVHAQNLARQTVPVEPIYIFDGADTPPPSLPGRAVVARHNLTIYQAWNVGLALVGTPFVMNLNLDDRLAPDAVERLEAALLQHGAALAAGDWKICYSQQETDAVVPCYPADQLPFVQDWPPATGTRTRLGTQERGTLGPATLWRLDTHIGAPRFPWRFADGTLIKTIGDVAWWSIVNQFLKKKSVRIPEIIGQYHSHPATQAEFRSPDNELAMINSIGMSLI